MPTPSHSDFPSLFFGEELLLSLRAFSLGFDFYHSPVAVCTHCWSRQYRPSWRELRKQQGEEEEGEGARRVVRLMTGEDAAERWLGSERTREQYWDWVGVDWEKRLISERAKRGGVEAQRLQAADGSAAVQRRADAAHPSIRQYRQSSLTVSVSLCVSIISSAASLPLQQ